MSLPLVIWIIVSLDPILASFRMNEEKNAHEEGLLKVAGCNEGGKLLGRNCCINMGYQKYDAPKSSIPVYNTITNQKIIGVMEAENTIKLDVKMEQSWQDPRIILNTAGLNASNGYIRLQWDKILDSREHPIIWNPWYHDISVLDMSSIKSHYGKVEKALTSIGLLYADTLAQNFTGVRMTMDFIVTIFCRFEYDGYPMDTEKCSFRLSSSPYKPMKLILFDPSKQYHHKNKNYEAFGFDIATYFIDENETCIDDLESHIGFDIVMQRNPRPFIFQYYLPCVAVVLVSDIGFIIPLSALPGRVTLGVTQFLALTNVYIFQQVIKL
jgi:hypothetical protein